MDAIEAAGFTGVELVEETRDFTFEEGREYVDWCRSHGARAFFEHFGPDEEDDLARELAEAAEGARTTEGIVMHTRARFWRAVVPRTPG